MTEMGFPSSRRRNPTARRVSPDCASLVLRLLVRVHSAPELFVFLAWNRRADSLQFSQMLLGFGQVVRQEIGLADIFVRVFVRRIELQGFVILGERGIETSGFAIRVAQQ